MKSVIFSLGIRDLVGNGDDFLIAREPFQSGPQTEGVALVIRRIEGDKLLTVLAGADRVSELDGVQSQLENFATTCEQHRQTWNLNNQRCDVRGKQQGQEAVWKGKVEFYAVGRDKALDSVAVAKECRWNGNEFTPLQ